MDLDAAYVPTNGSVQVTLNGGTGQWHRIEASTNLLDWRALTSLCQTNLTSAWLDTSATNFPRRFYRSLQLTPLDLYVGTPDTNYSYALSNTIPGAGWTTYVLEMRSQVWLTTNEVNRTLWKHWLIIVVPAGVTNTQSLLFIDGGSNPGSLPTSSDPMLTQSRLDTKTIVSRTEDGAQPAADRLPATTGRSEDDMIAYTWDKFLRTGDERWPARLPMTKAAVRAMDTVTAFCASGRGAGLTLIFRRRRRFEARLDHLDHGGGGPAGDRHHPARDRRAEHRAFLHPSLQAYGFWAPAVQDYVDSGIMDWLGTPRMAALMDIVDPYHTAAAHHAQAHH